MVDDKFRWYGNNVIFKADLYRRICTLYGISWRPYVSKYIIDDDIRLHVNKILNNITVHSENV